MAKEAATKTAAKPKAQKPRLRQVRELMLVEPIHLRRGPTNHFIRSAEMSITADLDAQILSVQAKGDKAYCVPFQRAKYWNPDVGTVKQD